jgi:hypothetical protein
MRTTTLAELGETLPTGIVSGEQLLKEFSTRDYRFTEEKELGKIISRDTDIMMTRYINKVIAYMVLDVGGKNFREMKQSEKLFALSGMFAGDVLYMYTYLRYKSMGNELVIDIKCDNCGEKIKNFVADLSTVNVDVIDDPEDLDGITHTLKDGVTIRGIHCMTAKIKPTPWTIIEKKTGGMNPGRLKEETIKCSVTGFEEQDEHFPIGPTDLNEMTKRDIETLTNKITIVSAGPDMRINDECPECGAQLDTRIDWEHYRFFDGSSLPGGQKS